MDIDGDGRLTGKEVILGISNENTFRKSQVNRFKQAHRSEEDTVLIEVRILSPPSSHLSITCSPLFFFFFTHKKCAQKVSKGAWV